MLSKRVIDKGHSIKFNNKYYRLVNRNNTPIYFGNGTKCIVIKSFDNKLFATINDSIFALDEIPAVQQNSPDFDELIEEPKKKIYIPKMTHPWKAKSFEDFAESQKHRNDIAS